MTKTILLLLSFSLLVGCIGNIRSTTTARTPTEILLVSTAAERAVKQYGVDGDLRASKVAIDDSRFDSVDKPYVVSAIRNHLSKNNVIVVPADKDPKYILELRNGTLGVYNNEFILGLPALPVVMGFAGPEIPPVVTPELAIFRRDSEQGWCKLQLWIYDREANTHVSSSEDLWGSSYYNKWTVLGIGPFDGSNDIYPD